jgi:hypothetical protein
MRFRSLKFLLRHLFSSSKQCSVQTYVRQGLHPAMALDVFFRKLVRVFPSPPIQKE